MNQGTNLGSQIGRWIVLAAVVALLGALLLTIRPVGAQSDGTPQLRIVPPNTVEHNENDGGPVYTFQATDPEGKEIFWTLSGIDAGDFMIEDGVLKFKSPPDFEIPLDDTTDNTPDTDTTDSPPDMDTTISDGIYEVTVRFSDGGSAGEHAMKVDVLDVEEDGMIMLSPLQPQVGTPLQAVIIDLDGISTDTGGNPQAEYVWAKADTMSGSYADIAGAVAMAYTPTADDVDSYLQVKVTYLEHASTSRATTATGTATLPVRPDTHQNEAPVVPTTGQGGQGRTGAATETAIIRYIAEDAAVGDNVGPPVTAVDDNLDTLTYSLGPVAATGDAQIAAEADAAPFDIDPESGQITTNRALDFTESLDSPVDSATGVEVTVRGVVVTVIDPDGEQLNIRVEIRVTDVDEAPLFTLTDDPDGLPDDANREKSIVEHAPAEDLIIGTYAAVDPDDIGTPVAWSTGGDDGGAFGITTPQGLLTLIRGPLTGDPPTGGPDYENPGDDNGDNLYELTVIATDGTDMTSSLAVTVKVTNDPIDDDFNAEGELEIFNRQPEVNTLLSVEEDNPTDLDDNVRSVKWQWYWQTASTDAPGEGDPVVPVVCTTFAAFVPYNPDDPGTTGDPDLNPESLWMKIDGATSSSYLVSEDRVDTYDTITPQPGDRDDPLVLDAFDCLMVRASYLDDGPRPADDSSTEGYDESRQYAYDVSDFSVQPQDKANVEPEFRDGYTAVTDVQVRPRILENFTAGNAIFSAVQLANATDQDSIPGNFLMPPDSPAVGVIRILDGTFTDDNDDGTIDPFEGAYNFDDVTSTTDHKLTFRISGTDAEDFAVDKATGAVTFMVSPDYEVLAEQRYTFILTAHDPTDETDSITVILDVENIDEPPTFNDPPTLDDPGFTGGAAAVDSDENSTETVETYTGNDPEGDDYFWGLTGTDAALFDIGVISGRLTFRNAPNYEDPDDVVGNGSVADDGVYDVTVHLLLDGESIIPGAPDDRQLMVAITVVDVEEAPVFTKTTNDDDMVVPTELNIAENKQPDTMRNRAVSNSPQASDEDEIPEDVTDNTNDGTYASVALLYELSGPGTEAFSIVPATGELRTTRVLDYESGDRRFVVKVTATDPTHSSDNDSSDSIDLVINVTDEDEAPVGGGTNQAPQFQSSTMTRSVAENTDAGMDIGVRVTATDNDGNTLTYTKDGTDAGHFDIDAATGQLKTSGALDYESKSSYTVTVTATDDDSTKPLSDETTVTIEVTNVEEPGTVTLVPTRPSVGTEITATLEDDDIVSSESWQWASADAMDGTFTNITGATDASYEPDDDDANMWLRATATYDSGKTAIAVSASVVTQLAVNGPDDVDYDENGTSAVGTYVASGADSVQWSLSGDDDGAFDILGGVLTFSASPNYEARADADMDNVYMVTVVASDGTAMDSRDVAVTVIDVDEGGSVTGLPASAMVGTVLTATLSDPDSGVTRTTWQWDRAGTDIDDATSASYTVAEEDAGMSLEATATYDDVHGTGKMATSEAVMISADVVGRYDTNDDETVDALELSVAISDYLSGELDPVELSEVIAAYING